MAGFVVAAVPASAAPPEYQITGEWAPGTPQTTSNGNLVTAEWRVNLNDSANPPANDMVPNVNFKVTAAHGKFAAIPTPCKTAGVTPKSSISADGVTLVCNLGPVKEGTAEVVQGPMVVNGLTGQKISAVGTIDGHTATVPEIPISNVFKEDILWGTPSNQRAYTRAGAPTDVAFGLEWTLRTAPRSDPGPANVTYTLNITNTTNRSLTVGAPILNRASCTQYNYANPADGHPFSGRNVANENAPFVKSCSLTHVRGTTYQLKLTGIDYSKTLLPTEDSAGRPLPAAWQPVASGTIWLTMHNELAATSVNLHSSAPLYRSPTGKSFRDIDTSAAVTSNRTSKFLPLPGNWSASWARGFTGSGGTAWDNTYKLPVRTEVEAVVTDEYGKTAGVPNTALLGECAVLDTKYVTYVSSVAVKWQSPTGNTTPVPLAGAHFQYYTGAGDRSTNAKRLAPLNAAYNPNLFTCDGNVGWQNAKPGPGAIRAVRVTYRRSAVANHNAQLRVVERLRTTIPGTTPPRDVPVNQDVWMFGSTLQGWRSPHWINPRRDTTTPGANQRVPGSRYRYTTGARDVLHIIGPTPIISKSASPRVVGAGEPATFTLNYHMEAGPNLRFNNVRIVDTLAPGETYVAGSASPAPTSVVGRTLTWVRSGVVSNALLKITYKATAAGAAGQALTNNVAMTYLNQTARASAQVTISTSGYTSILKTSDLQYIPNLKGDGSGTDAWTITLKSNDPLPQAFTDTIDILPYKGDGRGTSFSGTYTVGQITPPAGGTVYYTTHDPTTLSDVPEDTTNGGKAGTVGGTAGWSTTYSPNATAVRVIGPQLAPGATQQFKVPITTASAKSGDVWVNRAQAQAGHTRLVMRTSAPMTMAQYYAATLKKYVQDINGEWHDANGPADFPAFHYGDTIHYRVVVTNVGEGTITNIDVSDDKQPQLGAFHIDRLASGESQSHEYSITLDESQNGDVVNTACAKADTPPDMTTPPDIPCDPAGFKVTNYITEKTADPESGTAVEPGGVIHYTITVTQQGTEPADAMFSDDLTKVLDDADYNDDVQADIGTATFKESAINWSGTVPVGGTATVTYSVTVHDAAALAKNGDTDLYNPVTSPGCVPKDGQFPDCTTDHKTGYYTYSKVSDPKSGSDVGSTDTIKYTVMVTQQGEAAVPGAVVDDDMTKALDDATYNKDAKPSAGSVSYAAPTLTWKGDLAVGQKVTITYTMTVNGKGDQHLANVVTNPPGTPGICDTSVGCKTHHQYGEYTYSKVADPASGSTVTAGTKVTYTATITQHGPGSVAGATVRDDLSKVLDDATYDNDAHASSGVVTLALPRLTWKGDLAVGAKVMITYSVTVTGDGNGKLANVVTSPDPRGACDTTIGCRTHHAVSAPAGSLAFTGNNTRLELILTGLLLAAGGLLTVTGFRRRRDIG